MKLSPKEPVDIVDRLQAASTYPHNRSDTCTLLLYAAREIERLRKEDEGPSFMQRAEAEASRKDPPPKTEQIRRDDPRLRPTAVLYDPQSIIAEHDHSCASMLPEE